MAIDPNINRIKFLRTSTAGKSPTSADFTEGELAMNLADKTLYGISGTTPFRFGDPDRVLRYQTYSSVNSRINGAVAFNSYSGKGALMINLPKSKFPSASQTGFPNTMIGFRITGYNLSPNSYWQLYCAGYTYVPSVGVQQWYYPTCTYLGGVTPPFQSTSTDISGRVRFVVREDCFSIMLGDTNTTWSNSHVQVDDITTAYSNSNSGWDDGWTIEYITDATLYNKYVAQASTVTPYSGVNRANTADTALTTLKITPEVLTNSTNLNTVIDPGMYQCETNVKAGTITNKPTNDSLAFSLLVEKSAYAKQTLTYYNNNETWVRNAGTANGSTWTAWRNVSYTDSSSTGNAATATKWATPTTFTFTGDTTGTVTFDGSETTKSIPLTTRAASTTVAGIVQLYDGQNSTSTTMALTANQGKVLTDAIGTKVDKVNPTSSGTGTHTGNFNYTGTVSAVNLSASSKLVYTGTDANIGLYDSTGSSARGINVGGICVSNQYADASKVPTNGAYLKGGLDADNVIRGATGSAFQTLAGIGIGVSIPFKLKDTNIASASGFVPVVGWNVQTSGGYRQVNSIGAYRPNANWTDSGVYVAVGNSDASATEAFLFQSGRTISSTAGQVLVKGISDYSNAIDASTGSLYGTADAGWRRLGVATIPQGGRSVALQIFGGTGYNVGSPQQARSVTIILKSGNGNPDQRLNMIVEQSDGQNLLANLGSERNACYVPLGNNQYEVWIYTSGYLSASLLPVVGAACTWTPSFTNTTPNGTTKPTGAFDAYYYTLANTGSNVTSADKLSTARNINGVAFDGTSDIAIQQQSVYIPANANLNNYITEGFYNCPTNLTAATILNMPTPIAGLAFSLLVEKTADVKQTITTYTVGSSKTFIRTIYSGVVGAWREVAFTDNATFTGSNSFETIGITNNVSTIVKGISLYGGATGGKPSYGFTFTGTTNAGLGTYGDVNGQWAVYLTCATAGAEKRGWIFQRSDNNTNVASISTAGVLSTNGNIQTVSDNTMINVGNNNDLALVKKTGGNAFVGVGLNTPFRISKSNTNSVDPSNTFTELFTVSSAGVANAVGGFNGTFTGSFSGSFTGGLTGNAATATKWATPRTISITGDATWSTSIDGSNNATGVLTLANSGVTAGAYKAVTVDSKGRVTAGATYNVGLVSASANNIAANEVTGNSNTYLNVTEILNGSAATSVVASQRITGTGTVTVSSDADGNLRIDGAQNITGNAATATKWATPRTITFTGDTTGSVSIDGSGNVSSVLTTRTATTAQTGIVQLNDTATSTSTTQALTANQGRVISNKVNSMAQVTMYDETSGHQGLGDNPTFTNVYGYPITVLFSVSYNSGSNPPYGITISNADGTLSFAAPGNVPIQVPAGHKYQLIHVGGGGRNNIHQVIIIR